jgi:exonuclease 3'-5' domain-containing protein 1
MSSSRGKSEICFIKLASWLLGKHISEQYLKTTKMTIELIFVDTLPEIGGLVDCVDARARNQDQHLVLYIDLEGENLSRDGTLSLLTLLVCSSKHPKLTFIVDIHTLGSSAFSTVGKFGKSLKDILESSTTPKVFFDVRNDSDALYCHYGIGLKGVMDIQLMESASRPGRRAFVSGLAKCIADLPSGEQQDWFVLNKSKGDALWNHDKGGSYKVFTDRPLSKDIIRYCVGDVLCLPALYAKYYREIPGWKKLIAEESQKRVAQSQKKDYQPHGREKARSPWTREQNKLIDSWITPAPPTMMTL